MSSAFRPSPARLLLVVVAGLLTVALVAGAVLLTVSGGDDAGPARTPDPGPSALGTPLAQVDTSRFDLPRESFCAEVDPSAVLAAVGADQDERVRTRTWENGQRTRLEPGLSDVSHEYGCSWQAASSETARAWVFAPPATLEEARDLVASTPRADGCSPVAGAPGFGSPSVAVECQVDGERTRRFVGLFGQAWLTCEVGEPVDATDAQSLAARASTWCPAVLAAADS